MYFIVLDFFYIGEKVKMKINLFMMALSVSLCLKALESMQTQFLRYFRQNPSLVSLVLLFSPKLSPQSIVLIAIV